MNISPQYAGDGAYQNTLPSGGLDREWSLLNEAMKNKQISSAADEKARTAALTELSTLLDSRAASIQTNLSVQIGVIADTVNGLVAVIVAQQQSYQDLATRLGNAEVEILQLQSDNETLRQSLPSDAASGTSNARPAGREYRTVVPSGS